jgi:seryl-tRNA synthetase
MIDIKLLRHDPANVLAKLARKSAEHIGRELLQVDASWRSLTAKFEELRAQQKQQSRRKRTP